MPLVRIDFAGISDAARRHAIADAVHHALVETMNVPADDRFQILGNAEAIYDRSFPNIERSNEWVAVQVFLRAGRTLEMKQAFYRRLVELLAQNPGLRSEDVMAGFVENSDADWSFGKGEAQYAKPKTLELSVTAALAWMVGSFGAALTGVTLALLIGGVSLTPKERPFAALPEIVAAAPTNR